MTSNMHQDFFQWAWIILVGMFAASQDVGSELFRMGLTVVSMAVGTVVSHFVKKFLNKRK